MNTIYPDSGLAAVIDFVREQNGLIDQAIREGRPLSGFDCAALSGAVSSLLDAIDARLPQNAGHAALKVAA
ncbi:MAG: hypothetical protein HOY79_01045 [Streptomyces sp.]|nr:hypothetical protein [Streptomyces sp.]